MELLYSLTSGWAIGALLVPGIYYHYNTVKRKQKKIAELQEANNLLQRERDESRKEAGELREKLHNKDLELADANSTLREIGKQLEEEQKDLKNKEEELKTAIQDLARVKGGKETEEKLQQYIKDAQKHSFSEIVSEQRASIIQSIQEQLKPLEEKLQKDSEGRSDCNNNMANTFTQMQKTQEIITTELHAFTKNFKVIGSWGEQQLVTLLQAHGFRENVDFYLQQQDDGGNRPDCVIKYGDTLEVIIDIKMPLESYRSYVEATDKDTANTHLDAFTKNIKHTIDELAKKDYHKNNDKSIGYVTMFIPIEGAYIAALTHDPDLYAYSTKKKILLCSTGTIFAILSTIQHFKQVDMHNKNSERIAKEARNLIDKFIKLSERVIKTKTYITKALEASQDSINYISTGRGNITSKLELIVEHGGLDKNEFTETQDTLEKEQILTIGSDNVEEKC